MSDSVTKVLINKYQLGDIQIRYLLVMDIKQVEMQIIPAAMEGQILETKFSRRDGLVQLKLIKDQYSGSYAGGMTMRNSGTMQFFQYDHQECDKFDDRIVIRTYLTDYRCYELIHTVTYYYGEYGFEVYTTFHNVAGETAELEMLSSFSMSEITPFVKGDAHDNLLLHRIRSKWSHEGRLHTQTFEDLQLEPNWILWQPQSERFGQIGTMPVKKYHPFVAVEDCANQVLWGAQLAVSGSWQMEVYRRDEGVAISGGLADREFGHWVKKVEAGESFSTPKALISVCQGNIDYLCQRLTSMMERHRKIQPKCEQDLPIIFNEYCSSWGKPTEESVAKLASSLKGRGVEYFVIDCGWFSDSEKNWGDSMGDYKVAKERFPKGIKHTVKTIKEAGMKPGIWFEIENVGWASKAYEDISHLLTRDGVTLTTVNRRFWDMRQTWVKEHLRKLVINFLKENKFDYLKMDYNDTIGIGCDGAESLGEGLRQLVDSYVEFVQLIRKELPNLVIENCASGGHRLEPEMMELCAMGSFSDAHECLEIPVIAANIHRMILPAQSQIWVVIRKDASLKRIAYVVASAFLGRMCFSGDMSELTNEQWEQIQKGIQFYNLIKPAILSGYTYFYANRGKSDRHLSGWQAILRVQCEETGSAVDRNLYEGRHLSAYLVLHTFAAPYDEVIQIPLPKDCPSQIKQVYSDSEVELLIENGMLTYKPTEEHKAIAIYLCER